MEWEPRTNHHGYTYYYHVPTGTMQWTRPDANSLPEADECSDGEDHAVVGVSVQDSDSSNSSNDDVDDDDDDDDDDGLVDDEIEVKSPESLRPLVSTAPEELHRVVLDTVMWLLREVWQSHVEIGQYVAASTRTLVGAVTPTIEQFLVQREGRSRSHEASPPIPAAFIPAKSTTTPYEASVDEVDEIRPEMPV